MPAVQHALAVPVLPSSDLDTSAAFYAYLGFAALSQREDYLRLHRDGIELHLYLAPGHDPRTNTGGCYLKVTDPDALRAAWQTDGIACHLVPVSATYGPTAFAVIDPDGNTLRIGPTPLPT